MEAVKENKGFTLIELLVVIAIIALLSSVVLASLSTARMKARDSKRIQDVQQVKTAIELYVHDKKSPVGTGPGWWAQLNNSCSSWSTASNPSPYYGLQPTYIASLPEDPRSPGVPTQCIVADGYWYYYGRGYSFDGTLIVSTGNGNNYVICSKLESGTILIVNPWGFVVNHCVNGL